MEKGEAQMERPDATVHGLVCPKCPDSKTCPALARQKPCPSCPPCGRCPEPAFECKKVPNYSAISASNAGNLLPMPRLNSFAQFN